MFFIYLSEQVRGIELGFKQFLTLQTSVIPVVPTQLFMSLAFYKFSRMLLSWHLRTSTPQPRNGNVPNEMQSENTKKIHQKKDGEKKKNKERERVDRLGLLFPCYSFLPLRKRYLCCHMIFAEIFQLKLSILVLFLHPSHSSQTDCLDYFYWSFHQRVHFWQGFTWSTNSYFTRLWSVSMCIVLG